jgi:arylsulfatase A-like enzyme
MDERIIPAYLKPLGCATGAVGKWNIGFGPGGRPTERGFDTFWCRTDTCGATAGRPMNRTRGGGTQRS